MDYTQYNYDALVQRITQLVSQAEGWGNSYTSSTGQELIQLIAQMTDQLNYMLERRTQENFLPTAKLASSVMALASSLSYRPRRMVSSQGPAQIQLVDSTGLPVQPQGQVKLNKYTTLSYNNNSFVLLTDVIVKAGQSSPTAFNIMEGYPSTQTYSISDTTGTLYNSNYILIPSYEDIEETSLVVFDADGEYNDVAKQIGTTPAIGAISFASSTDRVYDIRITNDGMIVLFGDGKNGVKPTKDITLQWVTSSGSSVNIQNSGLSFKLSAQTITDNLGVTPPNEYYYQITNTGAITGGLEAETISQIKTRAPDYVRSVNKAVTEADYQFWIKHSGIGGIVDSRVYGQEETGINTLLMNNVYVVYLNENGTSLSTGDLQTLQNFLATYKEITTHLIYNAAEIVPVQINLTVHRNNSLSIANSEIYDVLKSALTDYFKYQEGSLGGYLHYSRLVKTLHEYTIVSNGKTVNINDYVNVQLKALKPFTSTGSGTTSIQLVAPTVAAPTTQTFAPNNIEVIDTTGTVIATDDGSGNLNGGTVDYKTGAISFPAMSSGSYYIRYLQGTDMNFQCNPRAALTYSQPKADYAATTELLSTITIDS